ncbi:MAG: MBL fold metallo-hydrolase [Oscillospiraceae bacterium]|nr:MBL fold metallo-hydrolase [Oscillospiraceae bacterium]
MAKRKTKNNSSGISVLIIFALIIMAALGYFNRDAIFDTHDDIDLSESFAVHYIDVGQGDSILIQNPQNEYILIDTGERSQYEKLSAYLEHYKVKEFKYVIFTHPHSDHIGSADRIVKDYDIETLIMSSGVNSTKTFERLLTEIEKKDMEVVQAEPGQRFDFGGAELLILAPVATGYDNLNNYSVALKLTYQNTDFLFVGDMEKESENEVMEYCEANGIDLSAQVLKVAHHGSSTSSQKSFLERVNPRYAVIFCGEGNSYNHPNSKVVERIEATGATVLRTDLEGDIVIASDGENLFIQKGRGELEANESKADEDDYETEQNEDHVEEY